LSRPEGERCMSIGWLQPTMGIVFVVVWLISAQIIVGERGSRAVDESSPTPPAGDPPASPAAQP